MLEPKNTIDGDMFAAISETPVSGVESEQLMRYACDDACDMAYDAIDNNDPELAKLARTQLGEMIEALGEIVPQLSLAYAKASEVLVQRGECAECGETIGAFDDAVHGDHAIKRLTIDHIGE
jgi:hypothetical protein